MILFRSSGGCKKFAIFHSFSLRFMGNVEMVESNILVEGQFAELLRAILRYRRLSYMAENKLHGGLTVAVRINHARTGRAVAISSHTQGGVEAACATERT